MKDYIDHEQVSNFGGEGDLFGVKQSGDMTFKIANLKRDYSILLKAKEDVLEFLQSDKYKSSLSFLEIISKIDFTN